MTVVYQISVLRRNGNRVSRHRTAYLAEWLQTEKVATRNAIRGKTIVDGDESRSLEEFSQLSTDRRYKCGLCRYMIGVPPCRAIGTFCFEVSKDRNAPQRLEVDKGLGRVWGCKVGRVLYNDITSVCTNKC